jgi:virginiamycin B lyase
VYATETVANQVAEVNVTTHQVTEYPAPTPASGIIGGTAGQDGRHWFVELAANKLLSMDYATHEMREYAIPTPAASPFVIRSRNGILYYTLFTSNGVGEFNPATGQFRTATIPTPASEPIGLAFGRDGNLYTDESVGGQIAQIDPATMTTTAEYPLPSGALAFGDECKLGPDGAIWVPELNIGRLVLQSHFVI